MLKESEIALPWGQPLFGILVSSACPPQPCSFLFSFPSPPPSPPTFSQPVISHLPPTPIDVASGRTKGITHCFCFYSPLKKKKSAVLHVDETRLMSRKEMTLSTFFFV
ncbi:uncharacterized protein BO80DRAFT_283122 [Aspergillus ibericus CBS 121593]|uniref:Uncharacterized protein n=1 Tax=Aspergillus ibericus CBS 121593 TaxID=1448316 RepID=A0A395H8F0_9EURO|nr:hypothetical protein BO80DRAFT_283122 [Aspergillus ibericus CBS 121593]RAL03425.1 hypothetical protein BO80DRAFT_283122 [Aspergillus ibericus CBS 121593]